MEYDRDNSPFGKVVLDATWNAEPGIAYIHGTTGTGYLVSQDYATKNLSPEAVRQGVPFGDAFSYPAETTGAILVYELPASHAFSGMKIKERKAQEKQLFDKCPDYVRERGINPPRQRSKTQNKPAKGPVR